jgi:hypothetical protein
MMRFLLHSLVIIIAIVLAGVNLAYTGTHLNIQTREKLLLFNWFTLGLLVIVCLLTLFTSVRSSSPRKSHSNWPVEPPD